MDFIFDDDMSITEIAEKILNNMDPSSPPRRRRRKRKSGKRRSKTETKPKPKKVKTLVTSSTRAHKLRVLHTKRESKRKLDMMIEEQQRENNAIAERKARELRARSSSTARTSTVNQPTVSSLARSKRVYEEKMAKRRGFLIEKELRLKRRKSVATYKPTVPSSPSLKITDRMKRRQSMQMQLKSLKAKVSQFKKEKKHKPTKAVSPTFATAERARSRSRSVSQPSRPKTSPLKRRVSAIWFHSSLLKDTASTSTKKVRPKSALENKRIRTAKKATRLLKSKRRSVQPKRPSRIVVPKTESRSFDVDKGPFMSPKVVIGEDLANADVVVHFDHELMRSSPQTTSLSRANDELRLESVIEPIFVAQSDVLNVVVDSRPVENSGYVAPPPTAHGVTNVAFDDDDDFQKANDLFEALSKSVSEELSCESSTESVTLDSTTKRAIGKLESQMQELDSMLTSV